MLCAVQSETAECVLCAVQSETAACVLCAVQSETAACVLCAVQSETAACVLCAVQSEISKMQGATIKMCTAVCPGRCNNWTATEQLGIVPLSRTKKRRKRRTFYPASER